MDETNNNKKFCQHCGKELAPGAEFCSSCGSRVGEKSENVNQPPQVVIYNTNTNTNVNTAVAGRAGRLCNKWVSFCLCLLLGFFGAHKFYEGKSGMGILYLFTMGLFGIGWIIDIFVILAKPDPYCPY